MNLKDLAYWSDKVKEAYARFKAFVYYDNFNLTLRHQLAAYENDPLLNEKLSMLSIDIHDFLSSGKLNETLREKILQSGFIVLPKSLKNGSDSQKKSGILISNTQVEEYVCESNTVLFEGDIEIHLIATLWIMEDGIRLNQIIGPESYGYHLPIHSDGTRLGTEKLLFTKYFEKYQEWRDKGIKAAKDQIDDGNEVMLISLDIKNFFHSVQVNFDNLKEDLKSTSPSLTDIVQLISEIHTAKVIKESSIRKFPLLPIGLVSSGVIANWFLASFDKELKQKMAPIYYGRYVDDFFIVLANTKPPEDLNVDTSEDEYTKAIMEWLVARFFSDERPLKVSKENKDGTLEFSDQKYSGLEIQGKKLRIFYFSPDWPHAMLNKFQKTLQENSSAFWFLPDEEELKDSLDDDAYDMHYEDTINKFKSVSDVKASKYGASVFLAKRIKLAILHSDTHDSKVSNEIFRFLRGPSVLSLFNMWEKVFTYLVVTNDEKGIIMLYSRITKAIASLKSKDKESELKKSLTEYLSICLSMAFSLNPASVDEIAKKGKFGIEVTELKNGIRNLRSSLLTRHHYLPLPSLVLSNYYSDTMESLLSRGLIETLLKSSATFELNEMLLDENWRIPRWVYLQEICVIFIIIELRQWKKQERELFYSEVSDNRGSVQMSFNYVKDCCALFEKINNKKISSSIATNKFKTYKEPGVKEPRIATHTVEIESDFKSLNLKLGLSNIKIDERDLNAAIISKSVISLEKRTKMIHLLNQAEAEKVDLLILPETSVPLEWLYSFADEARRKQRAFIFGLEHFTIDKQCFNFSVAVLPFKLGKVKEALIIPRLKNHYSPKEEIAIKRIGKDVPKVATSYYHLFKWKGIQFTIYNCYELTDVVHRSIFRSELDVLFAIEYNRDTNYFSNIAEATSRDLHCYFVQANTSEYGDSRVVEPKETERMNPVRVKGGENNVVLRYEIDIQKLRAFQIQRLPYQLADKSFKTTPPDFDHAKVETRGRPTTSM